MKSTISYGYPYASAGIETALPVIENKSTPTMKSNELRQLGQRWASPIVSCETGFDAHAKGPVPFRLVWQPGTIDCHDVDQPSVNHFREALHSCFE